MSTSIQLSQDLSFTPAGFEPGSVCDQNTLVDAVNSSVLNVTSSSAKLSLSSPLCQKGRLLSSLQSVVEHVPVASPLQDLTADIQRLGQAVYNRHDTFLEVGASNLKHQHVPCSSVISTSAVDVSASGSSVTVMTNRDSVTRPTSSSSMNCLRWTELTVANSRHASEPLQSVNNTQHAVSVAVHSNAVTVGKEMTHVEDTLADRLRALTGIVPPVSTARHVLPRGVPARTTSIAEPMSTTTAAVMPINGQAGVQTAGGRVPAGGLSGVQMSHRSVASFPSIQFEGITSVNGLTSTNRPVTLHYHSPNSFQNSSSENAVADRASVRSPEVVIGGHVLGKRKQISGSAEPVVPIKQEKHDDGYEQAIQAARLGPVRQVSRSVTSVATNRPVQRPPTFYTGQNFTSGPRAAVSVGAKKTRSRRVNTALSAQQPLHIVEYRPSSQQFGVIQRPRSVTPVATSQVSMRALQYTEPRRVLTSAASSMFTVTLPQPARSLSAVAVSLPLRMGTGGTLIQRPPPEFSTAAARTVIRLLPPLQNKQQPLPSVTQKIRALKDKSVLAKYVIPQPPDDLHLTLSERQVCEGCGDEFVTGSGMRDHLERRSILLTFRCPCGLDVQTFYNRCAFIAFYNEHKALPGPHATSESFTASVLYDDTDEYKRCLEEQNKKKREEEAKRQEELKREEEKKKEERKKIQEAKRKHLEEINKRLVQASELAKSSSETPSEKQLPEPEPLSSPACKRKAPENSGSAKRRNLSRSASHQPTSNEDETVPLDLESIGPVEFFDALNHYGLSCSECQVVFNHRRGLGKHFTQIAPNKSQFGCMYCARSLPNKCAFQAHTRMHTRAAPYVCPECGVRFTHIESYELFRRHVERSCLHVTSANETNKVCPECKASFPNQRYSDLFQHMFDHHTISYHKCRGCPMAFSTATAAERHSQNTGHDAQHRVVRKCPMCDAVFESSLEEDMKNHLLTHFAQLPYLKCFLCSKTGTPEQLPDHARAAHASELLQSNTCEVCLEVFAKRSDLYKHIMKSHSAFCGAVVRSYNGTQSKHVEPLQVINVTITKASESVEPPSVVKPVAKTAKVLECSRCQMRFEKEDLFKRHQAKHKFLEGKKKKAVAAKKRKVDDSLSSQNIVQVPIVLEEVGAYSCCECSRKFTDRAQLAVHRASEHSAAAFYPCHLCAYSFTDTALLESHITSQHAGKARQYSYVCKLCSSETSAEAPKSFPHQGLLTRHLQTVHRLSREEASIQARTVAENIGAESVRTESPSENITTDTASVRRLYVSGEWDEHSCTKCDFSSSDRKAFVSHVADTHPVEPHGAVQCMECAACFTVAPALYRHLRVVHRMTCSIEQYLMENGTPASKVMSPVLSHSPLSSKSAVSSPSSSRSATSVRSSLPLMPSPVNDSRKRSSVESADDGIVQKLHECTVCYKKFTGIDLLRGHMRVHGMAFIQATRRKLAGTPVAE